MTAPWLEPYLVEPGPAERWRTWWTNAARELPPELATARRRGFVLTPAELGDAGVTRSRARHRVATGSWTSPCRGAVGVVDVRPDRPDRPDDPDDPDDPDEWQRRRRRHALDTAAAVRLNPNHVARMRSAATLHGLPTFDVPDRPELVVHPLAATGRHAATSDATLATRDLTRWWGLPVTTVARTVADLLRNDRRDGLMAADAALYEDLVTYGELIDAVAATSGWPGVRQARELLTLASAASESPLESLVRLRLYDDGFPAPERQVEIAVPGRSVPYRVDFLWPRHRLVLEADGRGKYDHAALRRERRRDKYLRRLGFRVERVFWSDVVHDWDETRALLGSVLS